MNRIASHILLWGSLLGLLVGCGQMPGSSSISGTVRAPTGGDIAGTQVFACYEDNPECARLGSVELTTSAVSAPYELAVPTGNYSIYALKKSVGETYAGWYAPPTNAGERTLVTPPATGIDIQLRAYTGTLPADVSETVRRLSVLSESKN